jgi:hypothetical protein
VGDQVAGFYDPETGEMVVGRATTGPLDGATRMILAHELDHALTDQVLDLPLAPERPAPGAEDTALAQLALIEGDATLAMQLYALRHVGLLEQLSGLGSAAGAQQQLTALPHHLRSTLTFPYLQGLAFVCRLHAGGGWKAVDRAYDEPPTTTAQVLFPERYDEREAAVDPRDPAARAGPGGRSRGGPWGRPSWCGCWRPPAATPAGPSTTPPAGPGRGREVSCTSGATVAVRRPPWSWSSGTGPRRRSAPR